ncbi:MAG: FecR domain-containing protein [Sphingomonas sp.]|jgi:transmembrane sensor|uniref:FecR family protein n=1 Tax=Sphingomonas sp. TaxID=28214 RepID=UPI00356A139F
MNEGDQMREAVAWHALLSRDDADWDGFTAWLEADAANRAAYDAVALGDALVDEHRDTLIGLLDPPAPAPWWRRPRIAAGALGGAIAATLAAVMVIPAMQAPVAATSWQTGAGERRTVAFADGAEATLAPATRLASQGGKLTLDGTAYFSIRHDPARPVTIVANGVTVSDVGTRFEMATDRNMVRVAVVEGEVAVAPKGRAAVPLVAGHSLLVADGAIETGVAAPNDVASWRGGRLVYDRVPLALVAADIARYAGGRVTVDPRDRNRRFSGAMAIGDRVTMARSLAVLMGLDARVDGENITLGDRSGH